MKFGIVVFPGSNCDDDTYHALKHVMGQETVFLWHQDTHLQGSDAVVVPGGFSYGDYLRCGAIAKFSPIMKIIKKHAEKGKLILGICNGFQILQEAGMLPGTMLPNSGLKFVCRYVYLKVGNHQTAFTRKCYRGQVLKIPIAHNEGNFFVPPDELAELKQNGQIVFQYCDAEGNVSEEANPNGSVNNIAGIQNREGNVVGLMPHPERASEAILGSKDGLFVFNSMIKQMRH